LKDSYLRMPFFMLSPTYINTCLDNILIIGGGIIGLSVGWQLLRSGLGATIVDAGQRKASLIAAGMVTPSIEAILEDPQIYHLGMKSLELYPLFLKQLEEDSGIKITIEKGALLVGNNRDERAFLATIGNLLSG